MKKIFAAFALSLCFSLPALAQDSTKNGVQKAWQGTKKGASKAWKGTKKGASAVGNKTAEIASKGASRVADKKSDEWTGPAGQTIYIDDVNKFYWVNEKGKHIYVEQSDLKAKEKQ